MCLGILGLLLLAACPPPDSGNDLERRVDMFNNHVRWGKFDLAAGYILPMKRATFEESQLKKARSRRCTGYEVTRTRLTGPKTATAQVLFGWTERSSTIVRAVTVKQIWKRIGGVWMLIEWDPEDGI